MSGEAKSMFDPIMLKIQIGVGGWSRTSLRTAANGGRDHLRPARQTKIVCPAHILPPSNSRYGCLQGAVFPCPLQNETPRFLRQFGETPFFTGWEVEPRKGHCETGITFSENINVTYARTLVFPTRNTCTFLENCCSVSVSYLGRKGEGDFRVIFMSRMKEKWETLIFPEFKGHFCHLT